MRKVSDIKYPHSARLFSFCKSVLDTKFGNVRVIDQDVGQILGFDPADCSHWKKGRKQIRSVDSMRAIATHLGVDERLVMDVASGDMTDVEAMIEYKGLGLLDVSPSVPESVRREWQRRKGQAWTTEMEQKLKAFFTINDVGLNKVISEIHQKINFQEAPLFLPEISAAYQDVSFVTKSGDNDQNVAVAEITPRVRKGGNGQYEIQCVEGTQTRPVIRFHLARAMAPYFIADLLDPAHVAFKDHEQYMKDIYCNVFAARLLVPAALVRAEMAKVDLSKDIVSQLSEVFWVSRSLMNRRLRDILSGSEY